MTDRFNVQQPRFADDLFASDPQDAFLDRFQGLDGTAEADRFGDNFTGRTAKDCCPRPCPGNSSKSCCSTCPASCNTVPETMDAVEMSPSTEFCSKTIMNWSQGKSCAPIDRNEMQCVGSDGIFTSLKPIPGSLSEWTADISSFQQTPFMLKTGDALVCRIRSANKNGWSGWSAANDPYKLQNCSLPWLNMDDEGMKNPRCECKKSCRATGCGGCCDHQTGTFWTKVASRACCSLGTCGGCEVQNVPDQLHRHKYCHVHDEDKNRTRKRTKWQMKTVTRKQEVIKPMSKTVKRIVLEKQKKNERRIKYETKTVKGKEMILRKELQQTTKIVMKIKKVQKPRTKLIKKTKMIKKVEMVTKNEVIKKIVQVKKMEMKPVLKYTLETVERRAVRMVKEMKSVQKEIPKTVPVPIGQLSSIMMPSWRDCRCFRQDCGCIGSIGCGCAYPACGCAPTMISPTETEIVITEEECEVPVDYIEKITVEVPKIEMVESFYEEPQLQDVLVTHEVPVIVEVEMEYEIPTIEMYDAEVEYPVEEQSEQYVEVPVQIDVLKELRVPVVTETPIDVTVPVEVDHEITEQRAVMEDIEVEIPVAIEYEEKIPAPPCHWHDIKHSHDVRVGLTHTHHHKD